jgi:hypothetical protein
LGRDAHLPQRQKETAEGKVNENDMLSSPEESVDDAEMPPEDAVVESTLVKREEPGEVALPPVPPKKQIKPAVLALGSIGGMLVLCLVMLMILLLLLLPGISAGF